MSKETFHFSPFSLNPVVGLLFRDGAPVSLEPRAVKVLAYLVRNRGRVVPKEELLDKVWADVFTTDAVLDRKSTRLNSSHANISYAVFCLKKKKTSYRLTA